MKRNVELRQERAAIVAQMHKLITDNSNGLNAEQKAQWERMDADVNTKKTQIDDIEKQEARMAHLLQENGTRLPVPEQAGAAERSEEEKREFNRLYERAYWKVMGSGARLTGVNPMLFLNEREQQVFTAVQQMGQQRATIGVEAPGGTTPGGAYPGSTAGFVVPVGFIAEIEVALKYYGPMLDGGPGMPKIIVTDTGGPLPFPTSNDTTQTGELVAEAAGFSIQDVSTGILTFTAYKFSSKIVKVSWEMLQDSAINIPEFLSSTFAVRLGRILNTYFTTGSGAGSTQPQGIVVGATAGPTAIGSSSNTGGSQGGNTIGSQDLTALEHAVDPWYRYNARYMMHDTTVQSLKQTLDKYGRPLWQPGMADRAPDTINGYRYNINNDMAQLQASASSPTVSNNTVLFGDMTKYIIRRVRDITIMRFDELYAANGQVGFLAFARYDGNLLDAGTHPVKYLVNTF